MKGMMTISYAIRPLLRSHGAKLDYELRQRRQNARRVTRAFANYSVVASRRMRREWAKISWRQRGRKIGGNWR